MNRNARNRIIPLSLVITQVLTCLAGGLPPAKAEGACTDPAGHGGPPTEAELFFDGAGKLLQGFSSHLPLLVLDTGGMAPDAFQQSGATGSVTIAVYDQARNDPFAQPDYRVDAALQTISLRVASPGPKPDYALRLGSGRALCGMDEQDEWLLLGTLADKSLMRNHLAYTLAAQAGMPAPQTRFCEVILLRQGTMYYAGVYTLAQNTGQWTMGDASGDMTLERLPYVGDESVLPTRAVKTQYPAGSLVALGGGLTAQRLGEIAARVDEIDAALYSTDPLRYLTYPQYLDEDSFVDFFVLNEFLCNYDAAYQALYTYPSAGGPLKAGPLGSFETAVDNSAYEAVDLWRISLHNAPWYERLAYSGRFWQKVNRRYKALRADVLSDRNVDDLIDAAAQRLGDAARRNWARWAEAFKNPPAALAAYTGHAALEDAAADRMPGDDPDRDPWPRIRQANGYGQELIRLKYILHTHGGYLYEAYPVMARQEGLIRPEDDYVTNSLLVLAFIALFFGSVMFARRRNR